MARQFGSTWWGKAWIETLETSIRAEEGRLSRGRTYARQGRVSMPEIVPGSVRAEVSGKEDYIADLSVRQLDDDEWHKMAGVVAARLSHSAALLSGVLPEDLLAEAREAGVEILPGPGSIIADCSCPDWGDPCKHGAALAYLVADAIDQDPFVLLLLRGRGRTDLMDAVRNRRLGRVSVGSSKSEQSPEPTKRPTGGNAGVVPAAEAYHRKITMLPAPMSAPLIPGSPVKLGVPPPLDSGIRLSDLESLARDAAARATGLLHQESTSALELDRAADLARRAAEAIGGRAAEAIGGRAAEAIGGRAVSVQANLVELSDRSGTAVDVLHTHAIAWIYGGLPGLIAATTSWSPQPSALESARMLVGPRSRVSGNTITGNGKQLRLGEEGLWWRFRPDDDLGWVLDSQGFEDPSEMPGL